MSNKKNKRNKKKSSRLTSSLRQHKQVGKTLIPPMLQIPGVTFHSWLDVRLPEMLWACLVISVFPRRDALAVFRKIAEIGLEFRDDENTGEWTLFHSQIPSLPPQIINRITEIILKHSLGYAALRPLLLFDGLPGRGQWEDLLDAQPQEGDWQTLGDTVLKTLDHQSQEATDVRWLSLLFRLGLGNLHFSTEMKDRVEELVYYPNKGDMRSVRPFIRSGEMVFAKLLQDENIWSKVFWKECLDKTGCEQIELPRKTITEVKYDRTLTIRSIRQVNEELVHYWHETLETSAVDSKHDTVIGLGLYSLAILFEMIVGRHSYGITGRSLLRTLVECRITLSYLQHVDETELWGKFRAFGTGQAKLAFLKLDRTTENRPGFVSIDVLEQLSNEDFFQEFVKIELGHWSGLDLRKMAEVSGIKDDYDNIWMGINFYTR